MSAKSKSVRCTLAKSHNPKVQDQYHPACVGDHLAPATGSFTGPEALKIFAHIALPVQHGDEFHIPKTFAAACQMAKAAVEPAWEHDDMIPDLTWTDSTISWQAFNQPWRLRGDQENIREATYNAETQTVTWNSGTDKPSWWIGRALWLVGVAVVGRREVDAVKGRISPTKHGSYHLV